MSGTSRYLLFGALFAAIALGGYYVWQDQQKSGIEISIGEGGVAIEKN